MQFTIFGDNSRQGSYLLFIDLDSPVDLSFGRFRGGSAIRLERGCYLYVGSALGSGNGSFPLASRLVRHASRSGNLPPHRLRNVLLELFASRWFDPKRKPATKKLHWHIDYLLDLPEAELSHIVMVTGPSRLEHRLAELAGSMPGVTPVADRLGAQDTASGTHLFSVADREELLVRLAAALPRLP